MRWTRLRLAAALSIVALPGAIASACSAGSADTDQTGATGGGGTGGAAAGAAGSSASAGTSAGGGTDGAGAGGVAGTGGKSGASGSAGKGTGGTATGGASGASGQGGGAAGKAGASGTSGQAGTAGAGGGGAGGTAGNAGTAGTGGSGGAGWPTCDTQPSGSATKTIADLWASQPTDYTPVWVTGVIVTAVSFGACSPTQGFTCQMYLQTAPTYASLAAGAHQGIHVWIEDKASPHLTGMAPGDVVDVYASALRYKMQGNDELRLHIDLAHPGCMKKTGTASPQPIKGVTLDQLTFDAYENTVGPLLVEVDLLKGKPTAMPTEIFAIYDATMDGGTFDAGLSQTESLTPYYLTGGAFTGLTADTWTDFKSIVGVYGAFSRFETPSYVKYRTLAPRTTADIVK